MTLHTLGTNASTSLPCLSGWQVSPPISGQSPSPADVAAMDIQIGDGSFGKISGGASFGVTAVLTTGTTHGTTSITSNAAAVGSPPVTQIQVGDVVLGLNVAPGTFVSAIAASGATITLSQAIVSNTTGVNIAFVRMEAGRPNAGLAASSMLHIPKRGFLKVLPGDVVAMDNTGWRILVSGNAISYAGSQWTFT